jgi:exopolyphosphatase / guanosine-5'-triphosphate,3'-diphosphate pyrophosphatase
MQIITETICCAMLVATDSRISNLRFTEAALHHYSIAMRRGVIDIGTNTVKLLVADVHDGNVVPVVSKDQTTRLGEGVDETKRLSRVAIARTIQTINNFLNEARSLGAKNVVALTTSAVRDAENRDEFLDGVRSKCGLNVQVIAGEREAELIFRGVTSDPEWSNEPILVVDVGGGSAEFIQGQADRIELFQSLPLGALRLTERFGEGRFSELCDLVRSELQTVLPQYAVHGRQMIGTGGTGTTAARILGGMVDHSRISYADLQELVNRIRTMPLAERKKLRGLPPERADIIVAGGAVFLVAMEVLGAKELTVSVRNLRYGALIVA